MTTIRHLNCGTLHAPPGPKASCHCLLLEDPAGLVLIDCGIGMHDVRDPQGRIGQNLIDMAGFQFHEAETALRQIERLGYRPADVRHIVLTHLDPDHAGGLADFPDATVHLTTEEAANLSGGTRPYPKSQFDHGPKWNPLGPSDNRWFGLEARTVPIPFMKDLLLVPLFGHTMGHAGVAVRDGDCWLLHAGDAYYLRVELSTDDHPVSQLAAIRADDNGMRIASLNELRRIHRDHSETVAMFGYHDFTEFQ
jgi:glyoxylase-like metal-dependent hydrolase (beta-lactamase superfamily II)